MTTYPCWVEPTDAVLHQILTGAQSVGIPPMLDPDQRLSAESALATAVGALHLATGRRLHGPGVATDEYLVRGDVRRVSTTFRPVREVLEVDIEGTLVDTQQYGQMLLVGQTIDVQSICSVLPKKLTITYRFGSTMTLPARNVTLFYAHQLYLSTPEGNNGECQLPERVTSVNREGVSMTVIDPMTFLDNGRTGVPRIDQWLSSYLAFRGARYPGVFSGDAPPPSNVSVSCLESA